MSKKLRRKTAACILAGVLLCLIIAAIIYVEMPKPKQRFAAAEDYYRSIYPNIQGSGLIVELAQFGFADLFHYAETVAVVTPLDKLTADNTFGISGKRYDNVHSLRRVKALQYFKNEQGYGESFEMTELCGLLEDGTLVMTEDCWPMEPGVIYLVFLRGKHHPAPVSACNGKYDLTHLELNCPQHAQVLLSALLELDLLTKKSVRRAGQDLLYAALAADPVYWPEDEEHIARENAVKWRSFALFTPWTDKDYPLTIKYGADEEGALYNYLKTMLR